MPHDFCQVDRKGRRGGGPNSIGTRHERTFADRILRSATDGRGRTDRSGLKMPLGRYWRRPWQGKTHPSHGCVRCFVTNHKKIVLRDKTVLTQPELPSSKNGEEKKTALQQGRKGANMRRDSRNRPRVVKAKYAICQPRFYNSRWDLRPLMADRGQSG